MLRAMPTTPLIATKTERRWKQRRRTSGRLLAAGLLGLAVACGDSGGDAPSRSVGPADGATLVELYRAGRFDEAIPLLKQQIADAERDSLAAAQALNNLGVVSMAAGLPDQAEPLLQRALEIREARAGTTSAATATTMANLAELYEGQARFERSLATWRRLQGIEAMLLPPEAAEHALTWTAIGRVEEALGQPAKAFAAYSQALALDQAIFGAEHPAVVADLRALASAQRAAGEVEAAEALEARADALTPETP